MSFALAADASVGTMAPPPDVSALLSPDSALLEEGKALYENGQMIAALGKFMTVLRKDPHNPEARQYLRMIVDIMRQNPSISASKMGKQEQAVVSNPVVQEEIRRMLQLRNRLTMDLKAITGVSIEVKGNVNQVWLDAALLFPDKSGGLKEQGIPALDRVSAWLKTYGQQPVIIHCYPEELQEPSTNGSLFLHRYSELFNFFVEEKHLPAQRFVSADLLKSTDGGKGRASVSAPSAPEDVSLSTGPSRVVIETIGSQSAMLDAMPSMNSTRALSQWLEDSIVPNRKVFNPEEGEWVNLDLAALTHAGLRTWNFTIVSADAKGSQPIYQLEGKGNLLKRLSWDGHDQKSGNFVLAGGYVARLTATNADGTIKTQEEILQVERTTRTESVLVDKPKPKTKHHAPKKVVKKSPPKSTAPANQSAAPAPVATAASAANAPAAVDDSDSLVGSKAVSTPPASAAPAAAEAPSTDGDSINAIWKQVIQFEPNQSDLKPTVKASLERIGKTLEVYPLQKVRITGFAMTSEPDAAALAQKRADVVRTILIDEYHVDKKRVISAGGKTIAGDSGSKVEMSITN